MRKFFKNINKFLKKKHINHKKIPNGKKINEGEALNYRGKTIKRTFLLADNDNKAPKS